MEYVLKLSKLHTGRNYGKEETEPIQSRKEQYQMRHEGGMRNIQQDLASNPQEALAFRLRQNQPVKIEDCLFDAW